MVLVYQSNFSVNLTVLAPLMFFCFGSKVFVISITNPYEQLWSTCQKWKMHCFVNEFVGSSLTWSAHTTTILDIYVYQCKRGKVDNSWFLLNVKWKWINFMYWLWILWRKKLIALFFNILIYKAKQFMMTKNIPRKVLNILEDNASGVWVGGIEQVNVYFFLNMINLH